MGPTWPYGPGGGGINFIIIVNFSSRNNVTDITDDNIINIISNINDDNIICNNNIIGNINIISIININRINISTTRPYLARRARGLGPQGPKGPGAGGVSIDNIDSNNVVNFTRIIIDWDSSIIIIFSVLLLSSPSG